jgi:hypothetical protein
MTIRVAFDFHVNRVGRRGEMRAGEEPPAPVAPVGRVPRVARLMALAIRFERLIRSGAVADYATLARLGHVTRARVTQIMNLLTLAPDIQEAILFLPRTTRGRDPIHIGQLQPVALTPAWADQRRLWNELRAGCGL